MRYGLAIATLMAFMGVAGASAGTPPVSSLSQPLIAPFMLGTAAPAARPRVAASRFSDAPMPNTEAAAPVLRTLGPPQAEFKPSMFRPAKTYRGEGFTFSSTADGDEQKRFKPTMGGNLSVPLQ